MKTIKVKAPRVIDGVKMLPDKEYEITNDRFKELKKSVIEVKKKNYKKPTKKVTKSKKTK